MESKIAATHRLQREGRWEEASVYREEMRLKFKADGMNRGEANEASWVALVEKFPPLGLPTPTDDAESLDDELPDLPPDVLGRPADIARDTLWVYERLWCKTTPTDDVPSAGALGLWRWAKANSDRFYEHLLPKALKERPPETDRGVVEDLGIEEIYRMLKDVV